MRYLFTIFFISLFYFNSKAQDIEQLKQITAGTANDSTKADAFIKLCFELAVDSPDEALNYGFKAKTIAEQLNDKRLKEYVYDRIGQCYDTKKNFNLSYLYYQKALQVNKELKDTAFAGSIYNSMGLSYYYQGKLDSSLQAHFKALAIRKGLNNKKNIAASYNNIGLLYRVQREFKTSIHYYNLSLAIKEEIGDKKGLYTTLTNIGSLYRKTKLYDSALNIFKQTLVAAQKLNSQSAIITSKANIGGCLNSLNRFDEAIKVFSEVYASPNVRNNTEVYPGLVYGFGEAYFGKQDYNKALEFLNEALGLKYFGSSFEYQGEINRMLAEVYEHLNQHVKALLHYRAFKAYNDSLYNETSLKNVNELTTKYETEQKEQKIILLDKEGKIKDLSIKEKQQSLLLSAVQNKQKEQQINLLNKEGELKDLSLKANQQSLQLSNIKLKQEQQQTALLNKENQLKDLSLQQKKRTILLNTLALIFITSIAGGAIYLFRSKQKTSKQLEEKNEIISQSLRQKEVLLKEIHHRVKNNLQVISSLLNLQSKNIEDVKALQALNDGRNRVKSMALIHQNLYRDDNLVGVDIKEYIEKLSQNLFASYNIQSDKVKFKTDIDHLQLDVDTVIPLGLILNELISNALKYAFHDRDNGILEVYLKQQQEQLVLNVQDNGIGMPKDWSYEKSTSMGYMLIQSFLQKLKGEIKIESNNGTDVQIIFTKFKLAV